MAQAFAQAQQNQQAQQAQQNQKNDPNKDKPVEAKVKEK
jgi:hypothetical protein